MLSLPASASYQVIKEGQPAPEDGYFLTKKGAQDTLKAIKTYRIEAKEWEEAFYDLDEKMSTSNENIRTELKRLEEQINEQTRIQARRETGYKVAMVFVAIAGIAIGAM